MLQNPAIATGASTLRIRCCLVNPPPHGQDDVVILDAKLNWELHKIRHAIAKVYGLDTPGVIGVWKLKAPVADHDSVGEILCRDFVNSSPNRGRYDKLSRTQNTSDYFPKILQEGRLIHLAAKTDVCTPVNSGLQ